MKHRPFAFLALAGCAVALAAGCSMVTSQQPISAGPSLSTIASPGVQASTAASRTPKWELPIPDHPSIGAWVKRFSGEQHRSFEAQLERACFYAMPAQEIFERQGLPQDLIYVALVESGFSPKARSHANAVGMWQFIPTTGKRFGLEQNQWVDERCHPLKAARAAAEYLSFLYDTFGSWPLALAAYNAGEKAVQGALDQSGVKTFWDLAENGYLPAETRDYVPKVLAAVKIIRNPRQYGFYSDPGHYVARHETVSIPGGVKLSWIGKQIGVPEASLQSCNPELCRSVTPPGLSSYELSVPAGKGDDVLAALAEGPPQEEKPRGKAAGGLSDSVAAYRARPGDSWSSLARKYKCSAPALAALNGTNPSRPLKAGQTLKVPAAKPTLAVAAVHMRDSKNKISFAGPGRKKPSNSAQKSPQRLYYPVRQGDTLSSIAERFRISVKTLRAQNELSANQKLIPGNRLVICTQQ